MSLRSRTLKRSANNAGTFRGCTDSFQNVIFNAIAKILVKVPTPDRIYAGWLRAIWVKNFPQRWTNMVSPHASVYQCVCFFLIEEAMRDKNYQQIMLTDLRDVVLQSGPVCLRHGKHHRYRYRTCSHCRAEMNSRWLANTQQNPGKPQIQAHVVCAGVAVGSGKAIRRNMFVR